MSPRQVGARDRSCKVQEPFGDKGREMGSGPPNPLAHVVSEVGHSEGLASPAKAVP